MLPTVGNCVKCEQCGNKINKTKSLQPSYKDVVQHGRNTIKHMSDMCANVDNCDVSKNKLRKSVRKEQSLTWGDCNTLTYHNLK